MTWSLAFTLAAFACLLGSLRCVSRCIATLAQCVRERGSAEAVRDEILTRLEEGR